jgi:hypothetical protein
VPYRARVDEEVRRIARANAAAEAGSAASSEAQDQAVPPAAAAPAPAAAPAMRERAEAADTAAPEAKLRMAQPASPLGTGHGRSETSYVTQVTFERATRQPAELLSVRYDRRGNLVAMGVLPPPPPACAGRTPSPFPGSLRFAPDPY